MSYDEEQARRSRVVVETPSERREVVHSQEVRTPDRSGISAGMVGVLVVVAIALITMLVLFWMSSQPATDTAGSTTASQPPTTIVQQPAPAQQPPVIIQQPAPVTQPAPIVVTPPAGGSGPGPDGGDLHHRGQRRSHPQPAYAGVPNDMTAQMPETKSYLFIKLPDRILLIDPDTKTVAEIVGAPATTGSQSGASPMNPGAPSR